MHCLRLNSLNNTWILAAENDVRIHNEEPKILPELIMLWIYTVSVSDYLLILHC